MFLFLTVLQAIVAAALVGVVLMQRSEGGGLGIGGNPNAALGARGAADFLTRSTKWLAASTGDILGGGEEGSTSDAAEGEEAAPPSDDPLAE